ncbi:hypothetical protein ACH5RR_040594 [Cinchona calisaya]|uniref:Uncharacterized protein n=1 Tax=Cinchona calisaya TaxID=153742 RepID=A0ABD2XS17_9GENT
MTILADILQSGEVRSLGNANDLKKSKNCELTEIDEPLELHSLKLPDSPSAEKDKVGSQTSTNCWRLFLSLHRTMISQGKRGICALMMMIRIVFNSKLCLWLCLNSRLLVAE